MSAASPVLLQYMGDGEFRATARAKAACDAEYVVGLHYPMMQWQERSLATHNHEFGWLAEAWQNLPERLKDDLPTPEHLRKRALIDAGYYDETLIDVGTVAAALRVAAFARKDEFAHVVTRGGFVVVRTAKSQSRRAMDRKTFQESKTAIMEIVAGMIGVTPDQLQREAGKAA